MDDATFMSLVALGVGVGTWVVSALVGLWRGHTDVLDGLDDEELELGRVRAEPMVLSYEQERHFGNGDF